MTAGCIKSEALGKVQALVGHCGGLTDDSGKDLSITSGYLDMDIIEGVTDNLSELKSIIEVLDYGIAFP
jgi:hypothetical protein